MHLLYFPHICNKNEHKSKKKMDNLPVEEEES